MSALNLALWAAGVMMIAVGYARAREPWRRYQALSAQDENIRRYEGWRGRPTAPAGTPSSADLMRAELRRRARIWAGVAVCGFILVFLGFVIR